MYEHKDIDRIDKLEQSMHKTNEAVLLMGKDVHQLTQSVSSIAASMEVLVKVQQDLRIMEDRNESRNTQLKDSVKLLHDRIDRVNLRVDNTEKVAENGESAYDILVFVAKTLGSIALAGFAGLMYYLITLKG